MEVVVLLGASDAQSDVVVTLDRLAGLAHWCSQSKEVAEAAGWSADGCGPPDVTPPTVTQRVAASSLRDGSSPEPRRGRGLASERKLIPERLQPENDLPARTSRSASRSRRADGKRN